MHGGWRDQGDGVVRDMSTVGIQISSMPLGDDVVVELDMNNANGK